MPTTGWSLKVPATKMEPWTLDHAMTLPDPVDKSCWTVQEDRQLQNPIQLRFIFCIDPKCIAPKHGNNTYKLKCFSQGVFDQRETSGCWRPKSFQQCLVTFLKFLKPSKRPGKNSKPGFVWKQVQLQKVVLHHLCFQLHSHKYRIGRPIFHPSRLGILKLLVDFPEKVMATVKDPGGVDAETSPHGKLGDT